MRKDSSVSGIGLAGYRGVRGCSVLGSGFRVADRDRVQHQSDEVVRVVGLAWQNWRNKRERQGKRSEPLSKKENSE